MKNKLTLTEEKVLGILRENARFSDGEIAKMLGISENEVASAISYLKSNGVIAGYAAVINEELANDNSACALVELRVSLTPGKGYSELANEIAALPEVEQVLLISGDYDLAVTVRGDNARQVALFVSQTIAPMEGILSTKTHILLERYKDKNMLFDVEEHDERGMVSP